MKRWWLKEFEDFWADNKDSPVKKVFEQINSDDIPLRKVFLTAFVLITICFGLACKLSAQVSVKDHLITRQGMPSPGSNRLR